MGGYLQRLVSRRAPEAGGGLRPRVATRSPIADHDQRIALPGFAAAGFGGAPVPADEVPVEPARRRRGAPPEPRLSPPDPIVPPGGAAPGAAVPAIATVAETSTARRAERAPRPPRRGTAVEAAALAGPRSRADSAPAGVASAPRRGSSPGAGEEEIPATVPRTVAEAPEVEVASRPSHREQRTAEIAPTLLAPPVAHAAPPPAVTPPGPQHEPATPGPEAAPARRETPAAAAPRPLTAESVSQIGALAPRRRSNLHFAFRQR